jgi:ribose transport system substrate-binding protein
MTVNVTNLWKGVALCAALAVGVVTTGCKKESGTTGGGGSGSGSAKRDVKVHKAPDGAQLKLAFVTNNASDFWKIAEAGVRKYESEKGVHVDVRQPPNGTTEEQNQILENLVSQGYHGVAVSVRAPDDQVRELNRAAERTNVITHDSDAPKSNRIAYIGTNNFEAGKVLGEQIKRLLPNGGKMAVFVGTLSADNAAARLGGVKEAIKGTKIEIVKAYEDNTDRTAARTNVENAMNAYPDLALVSGLWSYNGPAIADAIEGSGKKGKVLAAVFDEDEGTLKGIQDGTIACTVVQKPFQFGYLSSKVLHELATQGESAVPPGGAIDTGVEVIDAKNVVEFKTNLENMKQGKSAATQQAANAR